jgi:hypothetical protein
VRFLAVCAARNDHVVHAVDEFYDLDQAAFSSFGFGSSEICLSAINSRR